MRVDRRVPVLLLTALLLAGCTIPTAQNASSPGPTAPVESATSATPSPSPGTDCGFELEEGSDAKVEIGDGDDFGAIRSDISKAERFADGFWQRHWDQCFADVGYRAPDKRGVYTDDDPKRCDGTALDTDNAFYCADGHFVAYGRKLVQRAQDDDIGVPWVYLVVAHEWSHAVQQLLADGGYDDLVPNPLDGRHELQADCLAAATLWASDYEGFLEWTSEQSEQVAADLLLLSEESPWTKVTPDGEVRTGGPLARIAAFQAGLGVDGVRACFADYR